MIEPSTRSVPEQKATAMDGSRRRDAQWFVETLLPCWMRAVRHPQGGIHEALDQNGQPVDAARSTLVTARCVFSFAHLHATTGTAHFLEWATDASAVLDTVLRDADGGYRTAEGETGCAARRRSYDQCFALLALAALRNVAPDVVSVRRLEECWSFVARVLRDPSTGALFDDDVVAGRILDGSLDRRNLRLSQNPVMHMLEAVLLAYETTTETVWLDRAKALAGVGLDVFVDPATGAVREFVGPGAGESELARREPGHQYEWAWLLRRLSQLSGDDAWRVPAQRMIDFVEAHGVRREGPMAGAPFDAVDAAGAVTEDTHLLWPLTEAGKYHAAAGATEEARRIEELIFGRFFSPAVRSGFWVNQVDGQGRTVWPDALSRLVYHVAMFATEGQRVGLFHVPAQSASNEDHLNPLEETP